MIVLRARAAGRRKCWRVRDFGQRWVTGHIRGRSRPEHVEGLFSCLGDPDEDDGVAERFARAGRLIGIPLLNYVLLAPDGGHFSYRNERSRSLEGGDDL